MGIIWVGMDAHKKAINVAVLSEYEQESQRWTVENKPAAIRRVVKKLVREAHGREVRCCYEAGPCRYALQRQIESSGPVICEVVAPSLIPRKPGDRIKTDQRDARYQHPQKDLNRPHAAPSLLPDERGRAPYLDHSDLSPLGERLGRVIGPR